MKKVLRAMAAMVVFVMLFACTTAMADDGRVEISFCIGDETLTINGEAVTVEKPYAVGAGVTLVPVRVITEAFGAKVDWIGDTQTINISYPDVEIVLQIGNPVAEVNGKAEQLLAAPEVPGYGTTMVPLRFISETFGAQVSYDAETQKITVVKEAVSSSSSLVEGAVNSAYIGDSYYNWYMENPKDMYMDYRSFDGSYTSFTYDDNNYFYISVYPVEEDYDFEKDYTQTKSSFSTDGYSLVKADKDGLNSKVKSMHFQAKDKYEFVDVNKLITSKYEIRIVGWFDVETPDIKDECIRIISTFACEYVDNDTYDLSNVEDGFRTFEAEQLKLSFKVPEQYYMTSSEDSQNEFSFASYDDGDELSTMHAAVYSKSDVGSAYELALSDYTHNKQHYNEELSQFSSNVASKKYDTISASEYEYTIKTSVGVECFVRDVFFEVGEYVYNINVSVNLPMDNYTEFMDTIINSVKAEEIDPDEMGILMRNKPEATGTYKSEFGSATIELPNNYSEAVDNTVAMYADPLSGVSMLVNQVSSVSNLSEARTIFKEAEKSIKQQKGATIVSSTSDMKIGDNKFVGYVYRMEEDENVAYIQQYGVVHNEIMYTFTIGYSEVVYSKYCRDNVKAILATLKFE